MAVLRSGGTEYWNFSSVGALSARLVCCDLTDAVEVHRCVLGLARRPRRRRPSRRHLGQEVLRSLGHPPSPPVLLWLAGIPIPLVILIMLLH
jgi:hypothetical protein